MLAYKAIRLNACFAHINGGVKPPTELMSLERDVKSSLSFYSGSGIEGGGTGLAPKQVTSPTLYRLHTQTNRTTGFVPTTPLQAPNQVPHQ